MAWIESHQSLRDHPKTKRLARTTGMNRVCCIGWLHMLWWWALDYADDGDLSRFSVEDVEDGVEWDGEPGALVAALRSCGFIDDPFLIHDWYDFAGKLSQRREANRDRMRQARASQSQTDSGSDEERAEHVQRTSGERVGLPTNQPTGTTGEDLTGTTGTEGSGQERAADTAAPKPTVENPAQDQWTFNPAALSEPARVLLDDFRQAYGGKRPVKLNREQVRLVEEAVADLSRERLIDSCRWAASKDVTYGGSGVISVIRAARTQRQRDEERRPTNGRVHAGGASAAADERISQFAQFSGRAPGNRPQNVLHLATAN